ncbi:MAG: mechanosensitive ion channel family protein [Curvibacter sp.]|nr:MAG: mechanosensitive ion channel family protein [Curvibacter sp.]
MNLEVVWQFVSTQGLELATKVLGALLAWMAGRWMITQLIRLLGLSLQRSHTDPTLAQYLQSIGKGLLHGLLVLLILEIFGISTTSLAALLAGAGLALGAAWGGLLSHFAAGLFLQVLRPYRVGDHVTLAGITGRVRELGLVNTQLISSDQVLTLVGNNKVFSEVIRNYSALPARRVDCQIKLAHGVDADEAIARIRAVLETIPHVCATPEPEIGIAEFSAEGPVLNVRPFTHTDHYWQVLYDTYRVVLGEMADAGYPVPEKPIRLRGL